MFDNEFLANLKKKWLDYCEVNISAIKSWNDTFLTDEINDGGYRPKALLILGILTTLDKELAKSLPFLLKLCHPDRLVEELGLKFDPAKELEKREQGKSE